MLVREAAAEQLEERHSDWAYSKPVVILDIIWNLAFVVVACVVLFLSMDEKPKYIDWVRGLEGVTSITMVILMAVAFTWATRWFRRSLVKLPKPFDRLTGFNSFWYSHHLHGVFLYLVGKWYYKTTWMYPAVPVLLYAGERTLRFFRSGLHSIFLRRVRSNPLKKVVSLDVTESVVRLLGSVRHSYLVPLFAFYAGPRGEKLLVHPFYRFGNLTQFIKDACLGKEFGKAFPYNNNKKKP